MLSFTNANTSALVNDRQDRTNDVAGICKLCFAGLSRSMRAHADRVLGMSAHGPGVKPVYPLSCQGAIRAVAAWLPTVPDAQRIWRPERPFRLLAFACTR